MMILREKKYYTDRHTYLHIVLERFQQKVAFY